MRFGYSEVCLGHEPGERHPESPDRIRAIRRNLSRKHAVEFIDATAARLGEVTAVHDPDYVEDVRRFCATGGGNWDPDTVAIEETWDAALASAGLARWAAEEAFEADGRRTPFSLGRPPGHHAVEDDAMGFCFLNNVAIAVEYVIENDLASRVAILDWDVHHGNGTQDIFYDRKDVLYASVHEEGLYPGTGEIDETGEGDAQGTTLNIPLAGGAGDLEYRHVFNHGILPIIEQFHPDLVLVSAGFDAHKHDPISRMHVTTEGYGCMTNLVRTFAEEKTIPLGFVLEGGYSLDMLSEGVCMVHDVFDGREPAVGDGEPDTEVVELVKTLRDRHGLGLK